MIFTGSFLVTYFTLFQETLIESKISESTVLISTIAERLAKPTYFFDVNEIDIILDDVRANVQVLSIQAFTSNGDLISKSDISNHSNVPFIKKSLHSTEIVYEFDSDMIKISAPIVVNESIGTVVMRYSLESINQILYTYFIWIIGISLILSGVSGIISFFTSKKITNFLLKISKYSDDIASEKIPATISNVHIDELDHLKISLDIMNQRLESSKHKLLLSERFSSIGGLAARLTHDLRNPLSIIKMSIDNLKLLYGVDVVKQKQFERIDRSIDRITHQVDDVLDFVRIKPLDLMDISLCKLLKKTIEDIHISSNVKISLPEQDLIIYCDPLQIQTVFSNLIHNAIHAINNDDGVIDISTSVFQDTITINIVDSGHGIPTESINKIFEPLFTTKQHGTGLGLASCKTIIENHGGSISVNNNPTTFKIKLSKSIKNDEINS